MSPREALDQRYEQVSALRRASFQDKDIRSNESNIVSKYASIDALDKAHKQEILADPKLNIRQIKDPYDMLNVALNKWTVVGKKASDPKYSDAQRTEIARNYYGIFIAPIYAGGLKKDPPSEELWLKQAYKEGLKYDIKDAYDNSIWHGLSNGWGSGSAALVRSGEFLVNTAGYAIKGAYEKFKEERAFRAQSDVARAAELERGSMKDPAAQAAWGLNKEESHRTEAYYEAVMHTHTELSPNMEKITQKMPVLGGVSKYLAEGADALDLQVQSLPNQGWMQHSTSFIAEQAAQLPLYAAMEFGGGVAKGANLTKVLTGSTVGKKVFGFLMAGTEGYAYGTATRPQEDKGQAWRDAAGFAIFHGLFDVAGMGMKKLYDVAPDSWKPKLDKKAERLDLAQEGKRPANEAEKYTDYKKHTANMMAVGGVPLARAQHVEALHYIADMDGRGWTKDQIKEHEHSLLNADPAHYAPVLTAVSYIRSLLGNKKLGTLSEEDEKFLSSRLAQLIVDAGSEMNAHVEGMQEETKLRGVEDAKKPSAQATLDFYRAKAAADVAKDPATAKMVTPEQIEKIAQNDFAADIAKSAVQVEAAAKDKVKQLGDIEARKKTIPTLKVRSERNLDRYGQPSVRYSVNPDYKIKLDQYIKTAKQRGQTLDQFFEDMDDTDFAQDLSTHFYPKALRKAGVFFEHQNTREGLQHPNFMAFMYNYLDQMPREFGKALEDRLASSLKVQKYMNGRNPTDAQLMYYAKAMYNHVDNFLASGHWPKESNIFRSTQANMWQPTKWQRQLLNERTVQEAKNLKDMFGGNKKAARAALSAHKLLSDERLKLFDRGTSDLNTQQSITSINREIDTLITQDKSYERIPF